MVKSNRYVPTNKKFKDKFQGLAGTKTKKGHLTKQDRDSEDVVFESGELVKIEKNKIMKDGWIVKVDGKEYKCTNDSSVLEVPDCLETSLYYIPKVKTNVEVSIDKQSQIYKLLRLKSFRKNYMISESGKVSIFSPTTSTSILPKAIVSTNSKEQQILNAAEANVEAVKKIQEQDTKNGIILEDDKIQIQEKDIHINSGEQIGLISNNGVNIHGEKDIALKGKENINIKSDDKVSLEGGKNIVIKTGKEVKVEADKLNINATEVNGIALKDIKITTSVQDQNGKSTVNNDSTGMGIEIIKTPIFKPTLSVSFAKQYTEMPSVQVTADKPPYSNFECDFKKNNDVFTGVNIKLKDFKEPSKPLDSNITVIGLTKK